MTGADGPPGPAVRKGREGREGGEGGRKGGRGGRKRSSDMLLNGSNLHRDLLETKVCKGRMETRATLVLRANLDSQERLEMLDQKAHLE